MGVLSRVASWLGIRSMENPRQPLDPWHQALGSNIDGSVSDTGLRVNLNRALTLGGYLRGVSLIARTVAKLPVDVYRRVHPGQEVDVEHAGHRLLKVRPNERMTPFVFKQLLTFHAVVEGNGYAKIVRTAGGYPLELLPLDPTRTWPVREGGEVYYLHQLKSEQKPRRYGWDEVLHIPGLGFDGLMGYRLLSLMKEALGLGLATQSYGAAFFKNSARPNVALKHPGRLTPEARKNLRESWERLNGGLANAHRTAILEEGMDLAQMTINARDSQLIESKQFSLLDLANFLGIPPHKLGVATNVSYKSLEQENQSFLDDAIDPWLLTWEQECEAKLLRRREQERETHSVCFDRFPLVRADLQMRGEFYTKAIANGIISPDEARAREGWNPIPGGLGAVFYRPANLTPINADPDGPVGPGVAAGAKLLEVPDVRQQEGYDCGAAALAAVLQYWELDATPAGLAAELGTTPAGGTTPAAIAAALASRGLVSTVGTGLEVPDLARFFAADQPVLCPIQADQKGGPTSGHWVTVVGTGLGQVFALDPIAGLRLWSEEDWLERWHDSDAAGTSWERLGIAVGREPMSRPAEVEEEPDEDDDQSDDEGDPVVGAKKDGQGGDVGRAIRAVLIDALGRAVRRLGTHARRAAAQPSTFLASLDRLKVEHLQAIERGLAPACGALMVTGRMADPAKGAEWLAGEVHGHLLALAGDATPAKLAGAVDGWLKRVESDPTLLDVYAELTGATHEPTAD